MRQYPARALVLAAALAAPAVAPAQDLKPAPSASLACLTPEPTQRGEPEYPFNEWKGRQAGRVKVELVFTIPDGRPEVRVLEREGNDSFVDAVKEHVRRYRVPCLDEVGAPARLRFEYVFQPDRRPFTPADPLDAEAADRQKLLACWRHVRPGSVPDYPQNLRRVGMQGRVLAELQFDAADKPPTMKLHTRSNQRELGSEVESWAAGLRLPCHDGRRVEGQLVFLFRLEGDHFGFKPLTLGQFMGSVRGIQTQRIQFDTTTMGCPFDLQLLYLQPVKRNLVTQRDGGNPARRPLLEWLRQAQLDLGQRSLDAVFADSTTISVPCIQYDIQPKEKT